MKLIERTIAALVWIDSQLAICNAATAGPWTTDGQQIEGDGQDVARSGWTVRREANAAFIAAARTGYPAMLEGMKFAILELTPEAIPYSFRAELLAELLTRIEKLR